MHERYSDKSDCGSSSSESFELESSRVNRTRNAIQSIVASFSRNVEDQHSGDTGLRAVSSDTYVTEESIDIIPEEVACLVEELALLKQRVGHYGRPELSDYDSDESAVDSDIEFSGARASVHSAAPPPNLESIADALRTAHSGTSMQNIINRLSETITAVRHVYGDATISNAHKLGSRSDEVEQGREKWQAVANELELVQGLATYILANVDARGVHVLFDALCNELVEQTCMLLADSRSSEALRAMTKSFGAGGWLGLQRTGGSSHSLVASGSGRTRRFSGTVTSHMRVWASAREARGAVLSEVVRAATGVEDSDSAEAFAVLVIVDSTVEVASVDESDSDNGSTMGHNGIDEYDAVLPRTRQRAREEAQLLAEWAAVCDGLVECHPLAAASASHAVRALTTAAGRRGGCRPILVVLHASAESHVSANVRSLRDACDATGAQLCVEGQSLAMLAQHGRPPDAAACLSVAHALILEPGKWLAYPDCACLTWQHVASREVSGLGVAGPPSAASSRENVLVSGSTSGAWASNEDREDDRGHDRDTSRALAPALALWWALSRLGGMRVRGVVANAGAAAETFVRRLQQAGGFEVAVGGCGGAVRVSYSPGGATNASAAAGPGALAASGRERVGRVNRALYEETKQHCGSMLVTLEGRSGDTWLSFAPAAVVRARALWAPTAKHADSLVGALQSAVARVRVCEAARAAFNRAARQNSDIEAARFNGAFVGDVMCFASFRVVPHHFGAAWAEDPSLSSRVHAWTKEVFQALDDCFDELLDGDRRFRRKVETVSQMRLPYLSMFSRMVCKGGTHTRKQGRGSDDNSHLPFFASVYGNEQDDDIYWIALVPDENCKVADGEIAAEIAADLVSYATDAVLGVERGSNVLQ